MMRRPWPPRAAAKWRPKRLSATAWNLTRRPFAAAQGGRNIKAKAVADNWDDDEGESVGRPCRKTRAIKGGRGAVVVTGRPKAGQDPDDPADRAGDGLPEGRPAKVPPKSGCGVPA
jgi:hypothetical protein